MGKKTCVGTNLPKVCVLSRSHLLHGDVLPWQPLEVLCGRPGLVEWGHRASITPMLSHVLTGFNFSGKNTFKYSMNFLRFNFPQASPCIKPRIGSIQTWIVGNDLPIAAGGSPIVTD
jgi:hypothetical protein